jgi:transposase
VCQRFYVEEFGRPGLPPGRYFRLLLIGYFEGLEAERAIAWRAADSFALREFLGLVLPEALPDHSTISRTRRRIDVETHEAVFTWIPQRIADAGLVRGRTVGIDATTLEANAALRSIVRRDTGESDQDFLTKLAQASGIETPTRADLARLDRTNRPAHVRRKERL